MAEQASHLLGRLQPAFGVDHEAASGGLDRDAFADTGHDILQVALFGRMIEDVIGRDQRRPGRGRQSLQPGQSATVVATSVHRRRQPDRAGRRLYNARQHRGEPRQLLRRHDDEQQAFGISQQVGQADFALSLDRSAIAEGKQAGQPSPTRAGLWIGEDVGRAVIENQPRAEDQAKRLRPRLDRLD
ncbi:hypothetical protein D3C87_1472880 [compost metagenome]